MIKIGQLLQIKALRPDLEAYTSEVIMLLPMCAGSGFPGEENGCSTSLPDTPNLSLCDFFLHFYPLLKKKKTSVMTRQDCWVKPIFNVYSGFQKWLIFHIRRMDFWDYMHFLPRRILIKLEVKRTIFCLMFSTSPYFFTNGLYSLFCCFVFFSPTMYFSTYSWTYFSIFWVQFLIPRILSLLYWSLLWSTYKFGREICLGRCNDQRTWQDEISMSDGTHFTAPKLVS